MSKQKNIKDEDFHMEGDDHVESNNQRNVNTLKNINQALPQSGINLITEDVALRNLFHLGYNSKSLTKAIVNSIKFEDVVNTIRSYIENDELSVRTCGPLLLGLARVYDKQTKIFLEELVSLFQIKREKPQSQQNQAESTKANEIKVEPAKKNVKNMSVLTSTDLSNQSFLNNNVLSLSPLNDGLFSVLNNDKQTPHQMFTSESKLKSPSIMEGFRAQPGALDSKSKLNLTSNLKHNPQMIRESSLFEDEDNQDVGNFFEFISENIQKNNHNGSHSDIPLLDFNLNLNDNLENVDHVEHPQDLANKLIFNSEKKTILNLDTSTLNNITQKFQGRSVKNQQANKKFEFDEELHIDIEAAREAYNTESTKDTLTRFKNQLLLKETHNFDSLLNIGKNEIFKNKVLNSLNLTDVGKSRGRNSLNNQSHVNLHSELYDLPVDETFIHNFSNLDMKDFQFGGNETDIRDKLNKIIEEEKNEYKEKEEDNIKIDDDFNNNFEDNNFPIDRELPNEDDDTALKDFSLKVEGILNKGKGKKKETTFFSLSGKIKNEENIPTHQTFYNLLCLAQKDSIHMEQDKIFDNNSITIHL